MTEVFSLINGTIFQNYTTDLILPNSMTINGIGLALESKLYCKTKNLGILIDIMMKSQEFLRYFLKHVKSF